MNIFIIFMLASCFLLVLIAGTVSYYVHRERGKKKKIRKLFYIELAKANIESLLVMTPKDGIKSNPFSRGDKQ